MLQYTQEADIIDIIYIYIPPAPFIKMQKRIREPPGTNNGYVISLV